MATSNVNIISDYATVQRFKKMSKFELDLGKANLKQNGNGKSTVMSISDPFGSMFYKNYGYMINKIGRYGSISFYYTNYSEANTIYIFFNNSENEVKMPLDVLNVEEWLSERLYEIQEKNKTMTNGA